MGLMLLKFIPTPTDAFINLDLNQYCGILYLRARKWIKMTAVRSTRTLELVLNSGKLDSSVLAGRLSERLFRLTFPTCFIPIKFWIFLLQIIKRRLLRFQIRYV